MIKNVLLNRKALSITIFISLIFLIFLPGIFAIPFFTFFNFPKYMLHDARDSVMTILCSLYGENGFGLPIIIGNILYFLFLPVIIYALLSLGMWFWKSDSMKNMYK